MRVPTLWVLVGLPGSGKSTWAINNESSVCEWLSSDKIREALFGDVDVQDKNNLVFETMNKRLVELLKEGKSVIYDATNLNSKRRKGLLNMISHIKCEKRCVVMATNVTDCKYNNQCRDRQVPNEVIDIKYKQFQMPMYHEGWNDIEFYIERNPLLIVEGLMDRILSINSYDEYVKLLESDFSLRKCVNLSQDNPHHTLSVSRHMYYAYDYIKDKTDNKYLKVATLLHDIGKPDCKNYNKGDGKYANFIGHDNVSAYRAMMFLLKDRSISHYDIVKICTYIQLHMKIIQVFDKPDKFRNLIGAELYSNLINLYNADISAK